MSLLPIALLLFFAGSISCSVSNDSGRFLESDGLLVLEAEDIGLGDGWAVKTAVPGFTGKGYLEWVAEDTREHHQGTISYPITISESGIYQINVRCHQGGAIWDAANDMFIQIETAGVVDGYPDISKPEKAYVGSEFDYKLDKEQRMAARMGLTNTWRWWIWGEEVRSAFRVSLDKGNHSLKISGRSKGFIIDRIALFRVEDDSFEQQPPSDFLGKLVSSDPISLR